MTKTTTDFAELLHGAVHHAIHFLPAQGSLKAFVHHNTLHAFEHLSFFDALREASTVLNAECLLSESEFRQELRSEGITWEEVDAVLRETLGADAEKAIGNLGCRFQLQSAMLRHQVHFAEASELRWLIQESASANQFRDDVDDSVRGAVVAQTRRRFIGEHQPIHAGAPVINPSLAAALNQSPVGVRRTWGEPEWEAFTLRLLWLACLGGTQVAEKQPSSGPRVCRLRDRLLDQFGEDIDLGTNDIMIRFTSSFLDQGFAQRSLPGRSEGYYQAFLAHYKTAWLPPHFQLVGLSQELTRLLKSNQSSWASISESLQLLKLDLDEIEPFLTATLLALPGWGGMLHQVETRSDRVAVGIPAGAVVDFLAVRLVLERVAGNRVLRETGTSEELGGWYSKHRSHRPESKSLQRETAFSLYQVAQLRGWLPETLLRLTNDGWSELLGEIQNFGSFQRRCLFQLVIERSYRDRVLCGIKDLHQRKQVASPTVIPIGRPCYQFICCIDDREESLRRYLEQVEPNCVTFGYAGFFAVPMYYKGVGDAHYAPLCPIVIQPQHHVREIVNSTDKDKHDNQKRWRQRFAANVHWVHNNSRSFVGGMGLAFFGMLSTLPLVARVLFPHATSRLRRRASSLLAFPQSTDLTLRRNESPSPNETEVLGFTLPEMVAAVERLMRDIGMMTVFSRLVVVCGHGSASLNNPHESAYNCGACGGGRGGPNARAFCQMANDPQVRAELRQRGLVDIPHDTHFLAVFHNTCDDEFQFFDLAQVPESHAGDLRKFRADLEVAQCANAHERCRRFASAPETLSPRAALKHVQERAEDLSQTRPEYNHATNAACFVGRRSRTRGLFLDRRVFLASYDPTQDDSDRQILKRILAAVVPVCGGINLEYFFSRVDTDRFGCGSKLPHNVTSLLGVMDGAASDLRTGLSEQMVEIHQPIRLLFVIECEPDSLLRVINANPQTAQMVGNGWVNLAALSPETDEMHIFNNGVFEPFRGALGTTPLTSSSSAWYTGYHEHLEPAILE
ncbi:MAG: DUF2309 domain-containing protein [Pirellulaceae bacterium]|nr:DUF2309 domain-containing protein [Pirellulaceae bacterium]